MITLNPLEAASFAVGVFGAMQKVPELAGLIDLVNQGEPRRILEIGFGNGGTSWCWSKLSSVEQIVVIDLPKGPWGGKDPEEHKDILEHITTNGAARLDFISGNSQNSEVLEAVEARLKGQLVDVLIIDGDHSRVGVMADYDLYRKFVRPGGLIAFHDVAEHPAETGCEVKLFWDKLKADLPTDRYCEFMAEPTTWGGWGVIKIGEEDVRDGESGSGGSVELPN